MDPKGEKQKIWNAHGYTLHLNKWQGPCYHLPHSIKTPRGCEEGEHQHLAVTRTETIVQSWESYTWEVKVWEFPTAGNKVELWKLQEKVSYLKNMY